MLTASKEGSCHLSTVFFDEICIKKICKDNVQPFKSTEQEVNS